LLGAFYYPAVAVAVWFVHSQVAEVVLLVVAFAAAATSVVLAYSLVFITRRECPFCWTSHAVNWALLFLLGWLFVPDVLSRGI